jgi:DNA adenine methylase
MKFNDGEHMKKSPLKWVGGKFRNKQFILDCLQVPDKPYIYIEPFLGSGEVFYSLPRAPEMAFLADSCRPLMSFHSTLLHETDSLSEAFKDLCNRFPAYENENYYKVRESHNRHKGNVDIIVRLSAVFLYLNKFGFNGLYRENAKGEMNAPIGSNGKTKEAFDKTVKGTVKLLEEFKKPDCEVVLGKSFSGAVYTGSSQTFIYADPPYFNTFSDYGQDWHNENSTRDLIKWLENMRLASGSRIVMSNSAECEILLDKRIWDIQYVHRNGTMNSNIEDRGKVKEILAIRSFDV